MARPGKGGASALKLRNFRERNLALYRDRREGHQSYVVIVIGGKMLSWRLNRRLGARS